MREHEEVEELEQDEFEECSHHFHEEEEPKEDSLELVLSVMGEAVIGTGMRLGEEEGEDRAELLKQQQRFQAERCPRCGRPHHRKAAKS